MPSLILGLALIANPMTLNAAQAGPLGAGPSLEVGALGADLNLSPKRLVLDAQTRSATVYVFNQGGTSGYYSVDLVDEIMLADGRIKKVSDLASDPSAAEKIAKLKSARDLMLVTPRRIWLAPHESQTVRIRAHPPLDAAPGEYRTHLVITALPPEETGLVADQVGTPGQTKALSVRVLALYSLAIPVIYRQGQIDAQGQIKNITSSVQDGHALLEMDLERDGAASLYGDIVVRSGGRNGPVVGEVNGIGVYPELGQLRLKVPLQRKLAAGEHLLIAWRDQDLNRGGQSMGREFIAP